MSLPSAKEVLEMLRTGAMDEPERLDGYDWVVICKALEARAVLEEAGAERLRAASGQLDCQYCEGTGVIDMGEGDRLSSCGCAESFCADLLRSLASTLDPQEEK